MKDKFGFDLISESTDGVYLKYSNDGTKHHNTDYNSEFPEGKGKVILYVKFEYSTNPFVCVKQDGDTRQVYHGICRNENFFAELVTSIR